MPPPRGEDYETDETRPHVKPAQAVTADMALRKRAKGSNKRALPAGSSFYPCTDIVPDC